MTLDWEDPELMGREREHVRTLLVLSGAVVGILFTAWGLWVLYVGIVNVDPGSEIPRWLAFVFVAALLAVGVWLLVLVRLAQRRRRLRI